jgi:chromosome segregation protein
LSLFEPGLPHKDVIIQQRDDSIKGRDAIGPVNLRATVESDETESQLATMETEHNDLTKAIAQLRGGITKLNREARERLAIAFKRVDAHFQKLFNQLFTGGKAYLEMIESEDPLESGLEIYAQPPGKALQKLSLLSGGEQTLTATALIFAMFMTNPSPICVLDEIDAPLDDANVDRVCSLMENIARDTQTRFIVITHHRMTMARMDRLYGVTMSERGVSQLVSVDMAMQDELSLNETA